MPYHEKWGYNRRIKMDNLQQFVMGIAKQAGEILKKNFGRVKEVSEKSAHNLVTNVDKESEKFIISEIKKKYPEHSILGEESGEEDNGSEYLWVIDPLDGTSNYVHGIPFVGVSIAVCRNKFPIVGVVYLPMLDKMFVAEKGKGAYCNGKKISVSKRGLNDNTLLTYDSYMLDKTDFQVETIRRLMKQIVWIRMIGASVVNLSMVAESSADLCVQSNFKPWDIAAACLIIEEAGGKVTDNRGKPWDIYTQYIVASNGIVHEKILETIK